jgi:dihydroflavonol-4-reductase
MNTYKQHTSNNMQQTIVTGATGLVGSHVLMHLVKNKCLVTALKRENSNLQLVESLFSWYGISQNDYKTYVNWTNADVLDIDSIDKCITTNSNVYHCAAQVSFNPSQKENLFATNVQGTANVVNVCLQKKINKLCYVSSVATLYLNKGETTITESSFWKNTGTESIYGQSKYLAEMEVWRGIEEGLNAVMVNPSVIIGPHDFTKGSNKIFETSANGLKFYTNGINGFVDVNDVANAMIMLMNSNINAERFIVSCGNIAYKTLFDKIAQKLNVKPPSILVKPWLSGLAWRVAKINSLISNSEPFITKETALAAMEQKFYDTTKIKNKLNFIFTDIDATLENATKFYLKNN